MMEGPRRWFQFHLATCVVLMLCAGTILYQNLHGRILGFTSAEGETLTPYGWPESAVYTATLWSPMYYQPTPEQARWEEEQRTKLTRQYISWRGVFINATVAVLILAIAAFISETLIRRKRSSS